MWSARSPGHEPTEQQITDLAKSTPSTQVPDRSGTSPPTPDIRDLPVLLAHFGIEATTSRPTSTRWSRIWPKSAGSSSYSTPKPSGTRPGKRNAANHFVVVTGMEPRAGVVHLNDSGVTTGRDEQVPIATFEQAWAPNRNSAIVTK